jgi:hypothetical protein
MLFCVLKICYFCNTLVWFNKYLIIVVSYDNVPGSKLSNGQQGQNEKQQNTRLTGNPKRYVYIGFFHYTTFFSDF